MIILNVFSDEIATEFLFWVIILALIFTIAYFWARFVLSMKRQLWNQKQQINLLIKIAVKLGVSKDEVDVIEMRNNEKSDEFLS